MWLGKEGSCFLGNVPEVDETKAFADNIEQIAMFARCGICPFSGSAPA